jgi:hypothetical protein
MGVGPFTSPVSEEKKAEIKELIEAVLKTFTLQYTKAYAIALVRHIKKELEEQTEEWQLLERPKDSFKKPLKTGYLVKQGAIRKNWLKRFFVVRPDYKIDYYENEEVRLVFDLQVISVLLLCCRRTTKEVRSRGRSLHADIRSATIWQRTFLHVLRRSLRKWVCYKNVFRMN